MIRPTSFATRKIVKKMLTVLKFSRSVTAGNLLLFCKKNYQDRESQWRALVNSVKDLRIP
jgi:hypothetical protein